MTRAPYAQLTLALREPECPAILTETAAYLDQWIISGAEVRSLAWNGYERAELMQSQQKRPAHVRVGSWLCENSSACRARRNISKKLRTTESNRAARTDVRYLVGDWTGRIPKCGDKMLRSYFYEAANVLLRRIKRYRRSRSSDRAYRPASPIAKVPGGGRSQKSEVPVFRGAHAQEFLLPTTLQRGLRVGENRRQNLRP
jgi:hypothetical protein